MHNKHIEKLTKLGIPETEAKIYTALLEKRELSAKEIHELTQVPRTKVYEITQKMILRGLCIEKQMGNKKKYQAVDPKRAFGNIIKECEQDLKEKKELAQDISKMFSPIYSQGMQNIGVSEYVEIIRDLPSIHERYVSLVKNTKKELVGFVKGPYSHQARKSKLSEQESAEFEILKKGAQVRVLYEFEDERFEEHLEHIRACLKKGEKARVIDHLPIKMYIFDARYVLMALGNTKSTTAPLTMLVIEHPALAETAKLLFNRLWKEAKEYDELLQLMKHDRKFENKKKV